MPETPVAHQLRLAVDLEIEVGHSRGDHAVARMTGASDGLFLDVDEPLVLLRSTPGRGLRGGLPAGMPYDLLADVPLTIRSRGRDLGRVRINSRGRVRALPTRAGLGVARQAVFSHPAAGSVAAGVVAAVLVVGVRLRRWRNR